MRIWRTGAGKLEMPLQAWDLGRDWTGVGRVKGRSEARMEETHIARGPSPP